MGREVAQSLFGLYYHLLRDRHVWWCVMSSVHMSVESPVELLLPLLGHAPAK